MTEPSPPVEERCSAYGCVLPDMHDGKHTTRPSPPAQERCGGTPGKPRLLRSQYMGEPCPGCADCRPSPPAQVNKSGFGTVYVERDRGSGVPWSCSCGKRGHGKDEAEARQDGLAHQLTHWSSVAERDAASPPAQVPEQRAVTAAREWYNAYPFGLAGSALVEGAFLAGVQWRRADERAAADDLRAQVQRLATFIMENIPGEPSQSQGAIDTAIRLLGERAAAEATIAELRAALEDIVKYT